MGMNMILTLIAGIVMTTMVGTQVAPSIIDQIKVKKTQTQTINNQEVIFEAIKRYTTLKQVAPASMAQLISENYIDTKVNDNGFGGTYEIGVNKALGVATITTEIKDPKVQEAFLNSFMGTSKPSYKVNEDGTWDTNKFETKYVLPNEVMHGNALLMTGIPIQNIAPDSNIYKYWYDTSSGKAILKLHDGTDWVEVNLGGTTTPPEEEPIEGVPSGAIIMWSGSIASIPSGWALCNGANGTPDLRNKFVIGSSSDVSGVSNTSVTGANTKSGGSKDAIVVAHTHSGTANSGSGGETFVTNVYNGIVNHSIVKSSNTSANGLHQSKASASEHTHPLTINSTGSSGTNANLPPYYALAFIMKL
ncbi:hypothetical protein OZY48_04980 [Aliarcobacter cryaerophilus]|uniref:hypothetical protein n=1 Tax=Aliarcobacter cryaerophilus TaxID=28198 RepID=UPI003BAFE100